MQGAAGTDGEGGRAAVADKGIGRVGGDSRCIIHTQGDIDGRDGRTIGPADHHTVQIAVEGGGTIGDMEGGGRSA